MQKRLIGIDMKMPFAQIACLLTVSVTLPLAEASKVRVCVIDSTVDVSATHSSSMSGSCDETLALQDLSRTSVLPAHAASIEIYFCSTENHLDNGADVLVNLTNISYSLEVTGLSIGTRIYCHNSMAGFYLRNVKSLVISNIQITGCGFQHRLEAVGSNFTFAAMYIESSANISIVNVNITNTQGISMVLANNSNHVSIFNSTFNGSNHHPTNKNIPGGGIFIESCTEAVETTYMIKNCVFAQNVAGDQTEHHFYETERNSLTRGGGIKAFFRANTSHIKVILEGCTFVDNSAEFGGALYLIFQNYAHNVGVTVKNSLFENNHALTRGGAVTTGYFLEPKGSNENSVLFQSCDFVGNSGVKGGAVYFVSTTNQNDKQDQNTFQFDSCTWRQNKAMYGSAVLVIRHTSNHFIEDGYLPIPRFHSCSFIENNVTDKNMSSLKATQTSLKGKSVLFISSFQIIFCKSVVLIKNMGSAVYLYWSTLIVSSNSYVLFKENYGYQGGAIALRGLALLHLQNNIQIEFAGNEATCKGGAIYHSVLVDRSYLSDENCFIKFESIRKNVTLNFSNNSAGLTTRNFPGSECNRGMSIFLTSSVTCSKIYGNWMDMFEFEGGMTENTVATYPSNFSLNENLPILLIPGKEEILHILEVDESNNQATLPVYQYRFHPDSSIELDCAYRIMTNGKIKVTGKPNSTAVLHVMSLEQQDVVFSFEIVLDKCPPGYAYSEHENICSCPEQSFFGISECDYATYRAVLLPGYWAGYFDGSFMTSTCPVGYCIDNEPANASSKTLLPERASQDTSEVVCASNRRGILCGDCAPNTSVYYHSHVTFKCGPDENCQLVKGIVLLLVSEVLPTTLTFLAVILFDIELTSGALNGFIMYMQLFIGLHVTDIGTSSISAVTAILFKGLGGISCAFNLNFFSIPGLEFCLFKGANSLDLLVINYALLAYSFLLVVFTVLCLNLRCINRRSRVQNSKNYTIHGLTGFLVLCYAKTTLTSLWILTRGHLYSTTLHRTVTFYQGNFPYFGPEHLKYAIPALIALVFVTCLPPILLLAYPLCYKVLAALGLGESKFSQVICRVVPLEKFKPLFDAFQCDFKDNHRYFAGLYFVYRLLVLSLFVICYQLTHYYFSITVLFIIVLGLHIVAKPYKNYWHNKLNEFLFMLIILINGITIYIYIGAHQRYVLKAHTCSLENCAGPVGILSTHFCGRLCH